jgi:uncharacterized membrane protein
MAKKSNNNQIITQQETKVYQAPIPPSSEMARYEEVLPGAAERILAMAEKQSHHRQDIERRVIRADNFKSVLGSIFGFVAVIATLAAGVYTALNGQPLFGGGISLGGLAILGTAFFFSKRK